MAKNYIQNITLHYIKIVQKDTQNLVKGIEKSHTKKKKKKK